MDPELFQNLMPAAHGTHSAASIGVVVILLFSIFFKDQNKTAVSEAEADPGLGRPVT